ncbi:MAG TPA: alpha/beta hydrolase-fold protein [Kofleriaceae bacterium]|jgi:S-formylglutathione hydrolase FrmB
MKKLALLMVLLVACSKKPDPAPTPAAVPTPAPTERKIPSPGPANAGKMSTEKFHSDALGVDKNVVVYLPPGYDAGTKHYPVFYYLHGLGDMETGWRDGGHMADTAGNEKIDAIIVMPDGDDSFYVDSDMPIDYDACMKDGTGLIDGSEPKAQTCVHARKYETYMTKDLVTWVDGKYRTIAKKEGRAIAGLSMGGYGALMLAMRHPDMFAAAASHSGVDSLIYQGPRPYVAGKEQVMTGDFAAKVGKALGPIGAWIAGTFGKDDANWLAHDPTTLATKLQPGQLAIYLDCGTEDDFGLDGAAGYLDHVLTQQKIEHTLFLGPGKHNFDFWGPRLHESLKFLAAHVTPAS